MENYWSQYAYAYICNLILIKLRFVDKLFVIQICEVRVVKNELANLKAGYHLLKLIVPNIREGGDSIQASPFKSVYGLRWMQT